MDAMKIVIPISRRSALRQEARFLGLTPEQIKEVSDKLGLGITGEIPSFQTLGTSGGRSARGFTDIASIGSAGSGPDRKRERQLDKIIEVGQDTLLATRENKPSGVAF